MYEFNFVFHNAELLWTRSINDSVSSLLQHLLAPAIWLLPNSPREDIYGPREAVQFKSGCSRNSSVTAKNENHNIEKRASDNKSQGNDGVETVR